MNISVCRLPVPRWPHFLCGSIHPCPFQTKSIISIWWCSQAGLSEDTAWNWCVSFQVYWGRQLPFGNSLRMHLQHSLSIPFLSPLCCFCLTPYPFRTDSLLSHSLCLNVPFCFGCICMKCFFSTVFSASLNVDACVSACWPTWSH